MKKLFYFFLASFLVMSLNACSTDNEPVVEPPVENTDTPDTPDSEESEDTEEPEPETPDTEEEPEPEAPDTEGQEDTEAPETDTPEAPDTPASGKTLIVYYSFTNNVHTIATELNSQLEEADLLRVEPAEEGLDYAANNYAIGSALIAAIRNNPDDASSYPAIKTTIDNLADYNRIIVATPLWWSNMAAPMQTFLFTYGAQMEGKSIGLIVSSSSSGISGVESDAKRLIAGGNFLTPSLWIRSSQTSNCRSLLSNWLNEIN